MMNVLSRRLGAGCGVSLALVAGGLSGCFPIRLSQAQIEESLRAQGLEQLGHYLTGSFNSEAQSKADAEYFDIRLHIAPIWTERADGPWLYVEQARADLMEKPYRQRVYRLSALPDGEFKSDVYEMPDPLGYAGAWKDQSKLKGLSPEKLQLKDGCAVVMRLDRATGEFKGGTVGSGCPSTLRGATYATSEVTLTQDTLLSWDRGYNAVGEQVWGAKKGGYIFVKQPSATPTPAPTKGR